MAFFLLITHETQPNRRGACFIRPASGSEGWRVLSVIKNFLGPATLVNIKIRNAACIFAALRNINLRITGKPRPCFCSRLHLERCYKLIELFRQIAHIPAVFVHFITVVSHFMRCNIHLTNVTGN